MLFFSFLPARGRLPLAGLTPFSGVADNGGALAIVALCLPFPLLRRLLLTGDGLLARALPGPGVGVGALTPHRQIAAVTLSAIAADVHQTLDVHGDVLAEIAFDFHVVRDDLANPHDLFLGQVLDPGVRADVRLLEDEVRLGPPDAVDVGQPNFHPLVQRQIDSRDACHVLALPLLVLGGRADDPHDALAMHDLALGANFLDGRSDFHEDSYLYR